MLFLCFTVLLVIGFSHAADPITADPDDTQKTPIDLTKTDLTNLFCEMKDKECVGANLQEPKFAPTSRQCLARCANLVNCLSAFYSKDKICYVRGNRCDVGALKANVGGTDLYRLKKEESCSKDRPSYVGTTVKYTNRFCMAWGKKCPGQNLYDKPQNIAPYLECLKKCAKIDSCGSVDVFGEKCEPKESRCREQDMVNDESYRNYVRLEEGEQTCTGGRTEPSDQKPPPTQTTVPPKPVEVVVPPKPYYCRRELFNCWGNDLQLIPFVFNFERCLEYCTANDDCKSIFWGFFGGCWLKRTVCDNAVLLPWALGHDAVKSSTADCARYEPKFNYCVRLNKNCFFHDIKTIIFTPTLERCQYYCNYDPRCKSMHYGPILKICWLKDYKCNPGQLLPAIGHDSVKLVDGATC